MVKNGEAPNVARRESGFSMQPCAPGARARRRVFLQQHTRCRAAANRRFGPGSGPFDQRWRCQANAGGPARYAQTEANNEMST
jgi:hypothetical protein